MSRISARANVQVRGSNSDYDLVAPGAASSADATAGNNSLTTALADLDLVATTASNGAVALLGASVAYDAGTHQYSGTMGGNATITPTQGAALYALLNTTATALLAAQTALAGAPISKDIVVDVNLTNIKSKSKLKLAVAALIDQLTGYLTP